MLVSLALVAVAALRFDVPVVVTAQAPASNVETIIVPWIGARVGGFDHEGEGPFKGLDGQLLVGLDTQGTNEVTVPLAAFAGNIFVNTLGANDLLTLDFSTGDFTRQIQYIGGTGNEPNRRHLEMLAWQ